MPILNNIYQVHYTKTSIIFADWVVPWWTLKWEAHTVDSRIPSRSLYFRTEWYQGLLTWYWGRFLPLGKKASSYRGAYRVPLFISLHGCLSSVCLCQCMWNIRRFYWLRELYEADFHKLGSYGSGRVLANAWDVFRRAPSRGDRGRLAAVDFVLCFGWGGFFRNFSSILYFFRTHMACCKYEAALPHLPLY